MPPRHRRWCAGREPWWRTGARSSRCGSCFSCSAEPPRRTSASCSPTASACPGRTPNGASTLVRSHFHARADGAFTLVLQSTGGHADAATAEAAARRAAALIPGGKAGPPSVASRSVAYVQIDDPARSRGREKLHRPHAPRDRPIPGARTYLTGFPALSHDLQPLYSTTSATASAIAVPIAIVVLLFMFGTLGAVARAVRVRVRHAAHHARPRVGDRASRQHGRVRDQHRHADRARDRDRLLDARRVPLPRAAGRGRRARRRARDHDGHGRARDPLLGSHRRDRARAAAAHAAAVHALDGRRRGADPARVDRRLRDASCRRCCRCSGRASTACGSCPAALLERRASGAPGRGRGSRTRSCATPSPTSCAPPAC